jgi:ribosomal protein S3AE
MSTIKEKMIDIIKKQPEDSSYDEILQELSFVNMVNKGLENSKNDKITEHEKVKKIVKEW